MGIGAKFEAGVDMDGCQGGSSNESPCQPLSGDYSFPDIKVVVVSCLARIPTEYQLPVSYISPDGGNEAYCVATNLMLRGGDDPGWGPGVNSASIASRTWSRPLFEW